MTHLEVSKYVKAGEHPLAPFTLRVVCDGVDIAAALKLLTALVEEVKSSTKAETKPTEVKVPRNPVHCQNSVSISKTPKGTYCYIMCRQYDERGFLVPAGLIENDTDVKECYECKQFKAKEVK